MEEWARCAIHGIYLIDGLLSLGGLWALAAPRAPPKRENRPINQINGMNEAEDNQRQRSEMKRMKAIAVAESIMNEMNDWWRESNAAMSGMNKRWTKQPRCAASPSFHSNNQPFNGGWLWMKWMVNCSSFFNCLIVGAACLCFLFIKEKTSQPNSIHLFIH